MAARVEKATGGVIQLPFGPYNRLLAAGPAIRLTGALRPPIFARASPPLVRERMAEPTQGAVAQLGERLVRNEKVRGSTPLGSTNDNPRVAPGGYLLRR